MSADKSQQSYYWSELAELTHEEQVDKFGWCSCEEQEYYPYADCPRADLAIRTYTLSFWRWELTLEIDKNIWKLGRKK